MKRERLSLVQKTAIEYSSPVRTKGGTYRDLYRRVKKMWRTTVKTTVAIVTMSVEEERERMVEAEKKGQCRKLLLRRSTNRIVVVIGLRAWHGELIVNS